MTRFLIFFLIFLVAFGTPVLAKESPDNPVMEQAYKDLLRAQERLRDDYEALLRRMRVGADTEADAASRERLAKAVALMDELAIGYEMKKLEELIQSRALSAAGAKAAKISEGIAKVLQILDGIDPDWKPDPRIPTLLEQVEKLKELGKIQGKLQEETNELGKKSELTEADKQKLEQLKLRQKELQNEVTELTENLPDSLKPLLGQAQEAMDQAFDQLQQENLNGAQDRQKEAKERLDDAAGQLEDELRKYKDIENLNLLLHVEREIEKLRDVQSKANKLTIETHVRAEQGETLGRRYWYGVASLQLTNSKNAKELAEKLVHGNVPIFGRIMEGVALDMDKCGTLLRSRDGGEFTQSIQEDILTRLDDLLDALRRERNRRHNQGGDPPQQTNPDGSPPEPRLVPLPAELGILLKRQQYLRQKHERFMERFPAIKDRANMTEAQRRIYERLSQEQGENAGYLDSLLDTLFNRK